ncbi:prolactin-releasing peptide receptor-like [Macrobrachium rosenbergii]|uniref:prolactin-releasing peptide receptor-like n=1 Tax=Macrobrachium rosenbergii TaxID=79674 RepID=UPI0034D6A9B2
MVESDASAYSPWMESLGDLQTLPNDTGWWLDDQNFTKLQNDSLSDNLTLDSTNNSSLLDSNILSYSVTQAIFYIEYFTIFLLGIFGNCLVCYVVFRNKNMHTVTNYFITNLALADILLCVLAVPFTPLYTFMGEWLFGSVLCHIVTMAQGTSVYVSSLTLMSIAIDRFFVILYPFRPRLKVTTCYLIIISIWLFSLSSTFPYALYMGQVEFQQKFYCEELWPSELFRQVFSGFTAIMQFVVPFIIILYCYVKISIRMSQRVKAKPGSKNSRKEEADRERKRRTNRMLIAMVTIFGISWLPVNVVHLVGDYYAQASSWDYYNLCFFITHVIAMSSTCYNPFLYAWLNDNFRKEFQLVLPCFKKNTSAHRVGHGSRSERTCCNGNAAKDEAFRKLSDKNRDKNEGKKEAVHRLRSGGSQHLGDDVCGVEEGVNEVALQGRPESAGDRRVSGQESHQMKTFVIEMPPQENGSTTDQASHPLIGAEASEYF